MICTLLCWRMEIWIRRSGIRRGDKWMFTSKLDFMVVHSPGFSFLLKTIWICSFRCIGCFKHWEANTWGKSNSGGKLIRPVVRHSELTYRLVCFWGLWNSSSCSIAGQGRWYDQIYKPFSREYSFASQTPFVLIKDQFYRNVWDESVTSDGFEGVFHTKPSITLLSLIRLLDRIHAETFLQWHILLQQPQRLFAKGY